MQQLGYSVGLVVPGRVERCVGQPEVGAQVDHVAHPSEQFRNECLGGAVGQAQEHHVTAVEGSGVGLCVCQVGVLGGQAGVQVGHGGTGLGVACGHHHVKGGVGGTDPQQLVNPEAPSIPTLVIRGSYNVLHGHPTCWLDPISGRFHHYLAGHLAVGDVLKRP